MTAACRGWACVLACCAWLAACDGSGVPLSALPREMAALECAVRSQCTARPLELAGATCAEQTETRLANTLFAEVNAAIARGTARYEASAARPCLHELARAGCARFQTILPDVCLEALGGQGVAGAACVSHFDCRSDHHCLMGDTCPGTCQPRGASVESPCEDDRACASGWRCPEVGGRCAQPLPLHAPCRLFSRPCVLGSTCFSPTIVQDGTCEPVLRTWAAGVGETCAILAGYFCAPGAACPVFSEREGELPACMALAPSGGACAFSIPDPCPAGEYCEGDFLSGVGTCTARLTRGQACRSSRQCGGGDVCDGDVCVPRQGLGGACASEAACWSGVCDRGVCVAADLCAR